MAEVGRQAEDPGEKARTYLRRGLSHLAIEGCCFLHDHHFEVWRALLYEEGGGGTREGAAKHRDITRKVHLPRCSSGSFHRSQPRGMPAESNVFRLGGSGFWDAWEPW